ncbi:hypothetical protein JX360_05655 [Synechococcus bigranulatus str. 'Rupite']|uniref:Chromosome partition protein Smc n=1 Tax=Thermostichus vulcanus str. 'Rupite' TaxID=2813851 RepID=A0ABT0C9G6_THEVL|nr:hypothetical protein [Thermostichus vulcanus str. 'Rupite']
MLPPRQFWIMTFPALAGVTVAISGLGAGGSLLQAGAAGLATGMTGYVASALSAGEAKAQIQAQSLQQHQKQSDLNTLNLQQLQKEFATLRDILQNLQADLHKWKTHPSQLHAETQTNTQATQLEQEIESHRQLLADLQQEEQTLQDSIQDLQTKRQKLIQYLKDGIAKVEQLQSKRDLLNQDINRLTQSRQSIGSTRNKVKTQVASASLGITSSSVKSIKILSSAEYISKYDEILSSMEEKIKYLEKKIKYLENRAKSIADLAPNEH